MMDSGALTKAELEREIDLGYARPSLSLELADIAGERAPNAAELARFREHDDKAGFVRHKAVYKSKQRRQQAIEECKNRIASSDLHRRATKDGKGDWLGSVLKRIINRA